MLGLGQMPAVAVRAGIDAERHAVLFADDSGAALGVLLGTVGVFRLSVAPGAEGAFLGRSLAVGGGQVPLVAGLAEIRREGALVFGTGVKRGLAGLALGAVLGERLAGLFAGAGFTLPMGVGFFRQGQSSASLISNRGKSPLAGSGVSVTCSTFLNYCSSTEPFLPVGQLGREGDAGDEVVGAGIGGGGDIEGEMVAEIFGQAVETGEIGFEFGVVTVVPIRAFVNDGEGGHEGVFDVAQEGAESAVGVGAGVVGFDGHEMDGLAARCEEVGERVQSAFGVEQERDRLQPVGGLEDDAGEAGIRVVNVDGAPIHALREGGELEDQGLALRGIGLATCVVNSGHTGSGARSSRHPPPAADPEGRCWACPATPWGPSFGLTCR